MLPYSRLHSRCNVKELIENTKNQNKKQKLLPVGPACERVQKKIQNLKRTHFLASISFCTSTSLR